MTPAEFMPPGIVLILGGLFLPFVPKQARPAAVVAFPLLTLAAVMQIPAGTDQSVALAGFILNVIHVHAFTPIFAVVFTLAALAGGIFALKQRDIVEMSAAFVYAGAAIGVTFAGDLMTLFIYWEMMAVGSTIIVLCGGTDAARRAAFRYAIMHFFGGAVLLAGIAAQTVATDGNLALTSFTLAWSDWGPMMMMRADIPTYAGWCILIGVLLNAAAPPFSSWLPDAYPEASPSGAVFLSAFTTKVAVFVLLTMFAGNELLIHIGMFMVFYGIVYAIMENDIRRILAYSVVNQVGFMLVGTGIGTTTALYGVAAHAFCHIIYKTLLFMSAGSVLYVTGKSKCTELGGLYKTMRWTMVCGVVGALSISAFPWTSGFVSKSIISGAAAQEHMAWVWFLLAAASAGAFLYVGIRFPWFVFFNTDRKLKAEDPPTSMMVAMVFFSVLCIFPGVYPQALYALLPGQVDYAPYTYPHVVTQLQLLLFAGLAFFIMLPWLKHTPTLSLDFDWLWRVPLLGLLRCLERSAVELGSLVTSIGEEILGGLKCSLRYFHAPGGVLEKSWAIGASMLFATALLGIFLILYYM